MASRSKSPWWWRVGGTQQIESSPIVLHFLWAWMSNIEEHKTMSLLSEMPSNSLIPSEVRSVGRHAILRLAPLYFGWAPVITFHDDAVRLPEEQCRVGPVGFKQLRDNGLHVTVVTFPRVVQNRSLRDRIDGRFCLNTHSVTVLS